MHIVHVTSFFQPGLGYQENCLVPAQAALGHRVTILTSDQLPTEARLMNAAMQQAAFTPGREELDGVTLMRLPSAWEWPKHNWVYLSGLWPAIEAAQPDIIHAHNVITIPTWEVLAGNRRRRFPLVVDDHNNYFNIEPYSLAKRVFYAGFRYGLRPFWMGSVGRVLPMSHEVRRLVKNEFGIDESRTTLVHLGADAQRFQRHAEQGRDLRAKLGIPADAVVIVNAGKITPNKDNHVLIDAMASVIRRQPRAWLLLIGNAPPAYCAQLQDQIDRHDLAARMTWVNFADNAHLPGFYSAADIGVWPGDWSITVLEAASCGLPLILPDREYAWYSIQNGNGMFFERGNAASLAEMIARLIADDAARNDMGRRSRELIERDLNWGAIARQTIEIYRQVIAARANR
jgi:glycosyltransferase involved in cell wall biosynthesis